MSLITERLLHALGVASSSTWAPLLARDCDGRGIVTPAQIGGFLANVLHETLMLTRLRESMDYNPDGLLAIFPSHFTAAEALRLGRLGKRPANQRAIAEAAYGGRRDLGNSRPGDGWTFRAGGGLGTTGRANYLALANTIGWTRALEELPDYLATPAGASESAAIFWQANHCNDLVGNPTALRRKINGGSNGLAKVVVLTRQVAAALAAAGTPPRLVVEPPHTETFGSLDPDNSADELNARSLTRKV